MISPTFAFSKLEKTDKPLSTYQSIKLQIDHDAVDTNGCNFLMKIIPVKRYAEIVLDVIASGSTDLSTTGVYGDTALIIACKAKAYDIAYTLLTTNKCLPGHANVFGNTALWYTIQNGQYDSKFFRALISTGESNVGQINSNGHTVLMKACEKKLVKEAIIILSTGESNPGYIAPDGNAAFDIACSYGTSEAISTMLALGNTVIDFGNVGPSTATPLMTLCRKQEYTTALKVLETGKSNPDHTDSDSHTALDTFSALYTVRSTNTIIDSPKLFTDIDNIMKGDFDNLVSSLFLETTYLPSVLRFFNSTSLGVKFLMDNSSIAIKDVVSREFKVKFLETYRCQICDETALIKGSVHSCGAYYHVKCIDKWMHHSLGEILTIEKIKCPHCRKFMTQVPEKINGMIYVSRREIEALDQTKYHKACKKCRKIFDCGDKSCSQNIMEFSDRCSRCAPKMISCPGCGMTLEHLGGCAQFTCCLKGSDKCTGSSCDHGSTESIKFCGHRWKLSQDQMEGSVVDDDFERRFLFMLRLLS